MDNNALARVEPRAAGHLRAVWSRYQSAKWGWHVVIPVGLGVTAVGALNWAWTMLSQNEYGVAMLLVFFFFMIGIGAAIAIPRRTLKAITLFFVVAITGFSALKIWHERGDKPWTALFKKVASTPASAPSVVPSSSPLPSPLPAPSVTQPSIVTPTPRTQRTRKKRSVGLTPEEKWILKQLNSNKHAHAIGGQNNNQITKEELKAALNRRLTKRGLKFLVAQVRRRGVSFSLTTEVEHELRDHAAKLGNRNIDSLILGIQDGHTRPPPSPFDAEPGGKTKSIPYFSKYHQLWVPVTVKIGQREPMPSEIFRYLVAYIRITLPSRDGQVFVFEIRERESLVANTCEFLVVKFDVIAEELLKELGEDRLNVIGQSIHWQRNLIIYHDLALPQRMRTGLQQYAADKGISLTLMGPTRKDGEPAPQVKN